MTDDLLVRVEDDRAVRRVILDSPHNRNALSLRLTDQLAAALAQVAEDARQDRVRAMVLTGTGPTFCAGADLKDDPSTAPQRSARMVDMLEQIATCPVPVVVQLNGNVRAGGLGILGAADIVVAPDSATFAFSEVRIGVAPAIIAVTLLPKMTARAAQRYFLTGETFDAAAAVASGLVSLAVPDDQVEAQVNALLDAFRLAAPSALRITRKLLRDGAGKLANREALTEAGVALGAGVRFRRCARGHAGLPGEAQAALGGLVRRALVKTAAALAFTACTFLTACGGAGDGAAPVTPPGPAAAPPASVVVVVIDGMRPDYYTRADAYGLRIPTLRALMARGRYAAEGMLGVFPTVTFPSHTTMVTGGEPAHRTASPPTSPSTRG